MRDASGDGLGRGGVDSWLALGALVVVWVALRWLSYPWPGQWWAAYLSTAPLAIAAIGARSSWRLAVTAYIGGLAWWLIGVSWLWRVTPGGYVALSFYLALYPLGFALGVRWVARRLGGRLPMAVVVPTAWVGLEVVRGWAMTGFPWFLLGHSQPTLMIQIADAFGAYGVSFVAAMAGGAVVDGVAGGWMGRGRPGRWAWVSAAACGLALAATAGYGAWRVGQFDDHQRALGGEAPGLNIAVVQTDVRQSNKLSPTFAEDQATFESLTGLMARASERFEPTLIVAPETVTPQAINAANVAMAERICRAYRGAFEPGSSEADALKRVCATAGYAAGLRELAAEHGRWLIVGAHAMEAFEEGRPTRRYNAAYLISPGGEVVDRFDKVHRVPFGEYVPFGESAPWLHRRLLALTPYEEDYSLDKGEAVEPMSVRVGRGSEGGEGRRAVRVGTPICFEDVVSWVCRRLVYGGDGVKRADVLVNLTNDGWYPGTAEGPQHEQIARLRCVENRTPMARSVNRGISSLIDSCGRVMTRVEVEGRRQMVAGVAGGRLVFDPRSTLFGRIGDAFGAGCVVATVVMLIGAGVLGRVDGRRG